MAVRPHMLIVVLTGLLLLGLASAAGATPQFPKLTGRVVDDAHMLSSTTKSRLTDMLEGLEQANGDQVVVVTLPNLGGNTIENYGYQLGRAWGIGQKKKSNGALLIIAKAEHKIRIEVGYGLEGTLTDAKSSVIIHRVIEPAFKKGHFNQGVLEGTAAIVKLLGGQPPAKLAANAKQSMQKTHNNGISLGHTLIFFLLLAGIIALFGGGGGGSGGRRRRRFGGLPWIVPIGGGFGGGLGGGSGGFGGGGFSGGGGSFGGGGASGGW